MRNSHSPCDQTSPTKSAGISTNSGPRPMQVASDSQAHRDFSASRYRALYRAWQRDGDRVLHATTSPTLADSVARRNGRLDCHVPAHRYLHLTPLVGTA